MRSTCAVAGTVLLLMGLAPGVHADEQVEATVPLRVVEEREPPLVFGDGLVATGMNDTFEGYRPVGEFPEGEEQIAHGTGILTNPLGAEYQATLRSHGPEDPRYMPAQIETLNGGCHEGEDYHPCRDPQASGFRWQLPFECTEAPECLFPEDENPLEG